MLQLEAASRSICTTASHIRYFGMVQCSNNSLVSYNGLLIVTWSNVPVKKYKPLATIGVLWDTFLCTDSASVVILQYAPMPSLKYRGISCILFRRDCAFCTFLNV